MKPAWLKRLLWLQAFVIVALAAALVYFARDEIPGSHRSEGAQTATASPDGKASAASGVRITEAARGAGGIEVSQAAAYVLHPYRDAFGTVVGLQPLLQLRNQLQAAAAEQSAARAVTTRAADELQRMRALYADDHNVSQRALQIAESEHASAQAHLAAAVAGVDNLQIQVRQGWGETLAAWAQEAAPGPQFAQLLERRAVLLQIASDAMPPATIEVSTAGLSDRSCAARYISPAPQVEPGTAGFAYFYRCDSTAWPVGARIQARLPLAGEGRRGVRVPAGALVWQGGKPWVYVQRDADRFQRHDASGAEAIGDDWFVPEVAAGVRIVTAGAQILLSEEMRYQIKNENED